MCATKTKQFIAAFAGTDQVGTSSNAVLLVRSPVSGSMASNPAREKPLPRRLLLPKSSNSRCHAGDQQTGKALGPSRFCSSFGGLAKLHQTHVRIG